jgi:hypothetical protein
MERSATSPKVGLIKLQPVPVSIGTQRVGTSPGIWTRLGERLRRFRTGPISG